MSSSSAFFRGAVKLELRSPRTADGISIDPDPDWTFDSLLSELNALEERLRSNSTVVSPFTKTQPRCDGYYYLMLHCCCGLCCLLYAML